jgi:hypothetical protein
MTLYDLWYTLSWHREHQRILESIRASLNTIEHLISSDALYDYRWGWSIGGYQWIIESIRAHSKTLYGSLRVTIKLMTAYLWLAWFLNGIGALWKSWEHLEILGMFSLDMELASDLHLMFSENLWYTMHILCQPPRKQFWGDSCGFP